MVLSVRGTKGIPPLSNTATAQEEASCPLGHVPAPVEVVANVTVRVQAAAPGQVTCDWSRPQHSALIGQAVISLRGAPDVINTAGAAVTVSVVKSRVTSAVIQLVG